MYIQIGSVSYRNLTQEEIDWLESQDAFHFVDVVDGDDSEPREIEKVAIEYAEMLKIAGDGEYIVVDNQNISFCPELKEYPSEKGYWSGETVFKVEK